jgi:hypothetical protein
MKLREKATRKREPQQVKYICPMGFIKEMVLKNPPRKINNLIVVDERTENFEPPFKECLECEKADIGMKINEEVNCLQMSLVKTCRIWIVD